MKKYRVEAYFNEVLVMLQDVKMSMVMDEDNYKRFKKLTEEEKQREIKENGWLQYKHMDVESYGNYGGMVAEAEDEEYE